MYFLFLFQKIKKNFDISLQILFMTLKKPTAITFATDCISPSIDARDMNLPPFDAPHRGDSNELLIAILRSLDGEIFTFLSFF
jgi:hypothetical protein